MGRARTKLVPQGCVEVFEFRAVLYYNEDGEPIITWDADTPEHKGADHIQRHEILGVLEFAKYMILEETTDKSTD